MHTTPSSHRLLPQASLEASVAIYGAGAIGLTLASSIIQSGHRVTIVARGRTLEALRSQGLFRHDAAGLGAQHPPHTFAAVSGLDPQQRYDYLIVAVKSQDILELCERFAPAISAQTRVLFAANGVPYWFSYRQPLIEAALPNTDNRDRLFAAVPPDQIIGSVVSFNAVVVEPGTVRLNAGKTLLVGEIAHGNTPDLARVTQLTTNGPLSIETTAEIRKVLWHKLLVNASINPASVIFQKAIDELIATPDSRTLITHVMQEVHLLGQRLGVCTAEDFDIPRFLDSFAAQRRGAYTSMYQDFHAHRPLELERIIDTVIYLAELPRINLAIPSVKTVRARLLAELMKLPEGRSVALNSGSHTTEVKG